MFSLADQNECVLAPSEPTEFSLYVHNLQNVERRGQEGCAISQPVHHHHHDSLIAGVEHRWREPVPPSSHISTRLTAVEIHRPVQTEWRDPGAGGQCAQERPQYTSCVFFVFIALSLLNRYCTSRRLEHSHIQCWYVRRPTSSSLIWFFSNFTHSYSFTFISLFRYFFFFKSIAIFHSLQIKCKHAPWIWIKNLEEEEKKYWHKNFIENFYLPKMN